MFRPQPRYASVTALAQAIDYARGKQAVPMVVRGGAWLDVFSGSFHLGDLAWADARIVGVGEHYDSHSVVDARGCYLVPGFIDSHVHVESSLLTPVRFQEAVLPNGTTTALWDPHELANVLGHVGIDWALAAIDQLVMDIFLMIPSCVPSTPEELGFERSGARLAASDLRSYRDHPRVLGLAEMMNVPGLLAHETDVLQKLIDFQTLRLDGHGPGLSGKDLNAYVAAGIQSCHESTTPEEAFEKLSKGLHVLIREGSCAKNASSLLPLLNAYTSACIALCSDDRSPLDIIEEGHIAAILQKGLAMGLRPEDLFRAASYAPAQIYGLSDRGALAPGFLADFCIIRPHKAEQWSSGFRLEAVYKRGRSYLTSELAKQNFPAPQQMRKNLNMPHPSLSQLQLKAPRGTFQAHVIEVIPGQIITRGLLVDMTAADVNVPTRLDQDILKIAVFERHRGSGGYSVGYVRGFGIKAGAIATSISHDSHNVIAVGSSDELLLAVIDDLLEIDGGICVHAADGRRAHLSLPIAGLMTDASPTSTALLLKTLKQLAKDIGSCLEEPFLQLSFLALPVIPSLKITDCGLIDVKRFEKIPIFRATGDS